LCAILLLPYGTARAETTPSPNVGLAIGSIYYNGAPLAPNLVSAISQSGVGWVRISLYWGFGVERTRGVFNWTGLDESIAALKAAHINVLITLLGPVPCWARPAPQPSDCKKAAMVIPDRDAWRDFVTAAVKRYGKDVTYWELWNEPDQVSSIVAPDQSTEARLQQYRDEILNPGADAVHAADPNAKVVATALSINYPNTAPEAKMASTLRMITGVAPDKIDVVSVHVYAPFDLVSYGKAAREAIGPHPQLWLTETGIREPVAADGTMSDAASQSQESFINNEFARALKSGVYDKMFFFALTDDGETASGRHGDGFGLIDNQNYTTYPWTPRPAYVALQKLLGAKPSQ
jgi:hypothetical protein